MAHVDAMLADEAMARLFTRHWCSAIPKAAGAADSVSLRRWRCDRWF